MTETLELLVTLLKAFEGCRLAAYPDIAGVWTIGYGETLGVVPGMVWSQAEADSRLSLRAQEFLLAVATMCPRLSTQRLAACSSLAYNIGIAAFHASSVRSLSNRGEWGRAADCFLLWNKAGGIVRDGLKRRRKIESIYYLLG